MKVAYVLMTSKIWCNKRGRSLMCRWRWEASDCNLLPANLI